MSNRQSNYLLTYDEMNAVKSLAVAVQRSKQNVGRNMLDIASVVHRIAEGTCQTPINKPGLEPGEVCLMCHSIGARAPRREAKGKPRCHVCTLPFKRSTPWRLYHGKRVHTRCIRKD